jgi:glycosyltransferase involved in cell wall biosynthesis
VSPSPRALPIDAPSVWVVIAAFDEAPMVGEVVAGLRERGWRCVVVDDGSADGTGEAAARAGASVVRHPVNLGQGAALQTGIDFALERGADCVVTFDADGQHDPDDLPAILAPVLTGHADVALGSRFLGQAEGIDVPRRLLLRAAIVFTTLTTGVRLTDAHNGLRALSAAACRRLRIIQNRMAHASELVAQISHHGLRFVEVPVCIRYTDYARRKGQGSWGVVRIVLDLATDRMGG